MSQIDTDNYDEEMSRSSQAEGLRWRSQSNVEGLRRASQIQKPRMPASQNCWKFVCLGVFILVVAAVATGMSLYFFQNPGNAHDNEKKSKVEEESFPEAFGCSTPSAPYGVSISKYNASIGGTADYSCGDGYVFADGREGGKNVTCEEEQHGDRRQAKWGEMMKCNSAKFVKLTIYNSTAVKCSWKRSDNHPIFKVVMEAEKLHPKSATVFMKYNVDTKNVIFKMDSITKAMKCGMAARYSDWRYATPTEYSNQIELSGKVQGVTLTPISSKEIRCSWDRVKSASKYKVDLHYGTGNTISKEHLKGRLTVPFVLKKGELFPEKCHCAVQAFDEKEFAISQPGLSDVKALGLIQSHRFQNATKYNSLSNAAGIYIFVVSCLSDVFLNYVLVFMNLFFCII
eukprot:332496_1